MDEWLGPVTKNAPGIVGAAIGLRFVEGETWYGRLVAFAGGCATAIYASDYAVSVTGADPALVGFVLGLFSMSVLDKLAQTWTALQPATLLTEWIRKRWL